MPAKSQAQQKLMGLVHAIQQGKAAPTGHAGSIAKHMKPSDAKAFASTPRKDLPQHVDDNMQIAQETITKYNEYGKHFEAAMTMGELAERLMQVAEFAEQAVMNETDDWFDKHTVSRNMKEMKGYVREFSKVAQEHDGLRRRMSALYDDMGRVLERYFEVGGAGGVDTADNVGNNPIVYDTDEDEIEIGNSDKNPIPSDHASQMAHESDDDNNHVTQMAGWLPGGENSHDHGAPFDLDDPDIKNEDKPENLYPSLRDSSASEMRFEDDEDTSNDDAKLRLTHAKDLSERMVRLAREQLKGDNLIKFDTLPRETQIRAAWKVIR